MDNNIVDLDEFRKFRKNHEEPTVESDLEALLKACEELGRVIRGHCDTLGEKQP